jgi:hypothetical protein
MYLQKREPKSARRAEQAEIRQGAEAEGGGYSLLEIRRLPRPAHGGCLDTNAVEAGRGVGASPRLLETLAAGAASNSGEASRF